MLSRRLFTRLAADAHCIGWLLDRELAHLEPDEALDTFERLTLIYDELQPVPQPES